MVQITKYIKWYRVDLIMKILVFNLIGYPFICLRVTFKTIENEIIPDISTKGEKDKEKNKI